MLHQFILKEKVQLNNDGDDDYASSESNLARIYNISLDSICNILKRKEQDLQDYQTNQTR